MTALNNLHSNITDLLPNVAAIFVSIPQALTARGRRFWINRLFITYHTTEPKYFSYVTGQFTFA